MSRKQRTTGLVVSDFLPTDEQTSGADELASGKNNPA